MLVRVNCPWSAARTARGISMMARGCSSEELDRRTVRWLNARSCPERSAFRSPRVWTTKRPPACPTLASPPGFRSASAQAPGENVLILGATGVTGKLAVKIAKLLGARRVVAAGRNEQVLGTLHKHGADAIIRLDRPAQELSDAFASEVGNAGFQVVIDYVWGRPTEGFLTTITRKDFTVVTSETRLVQVGESAGPTISLPAAVLRSTALTILGTAGLPPREILVDALQQVMAHAVTGELHVDTERVPLASIGEAWQRDQHGRRLVIIPLPSEPASLRSDS